MVDSDVFGPELAGRATSPALSNASELTVLSRSPSPVPDYQKVFLRLESTLPLTPPSTPKRPRAANGRFKPHNRKRASSPYPHMNNSSKRPRTPREPQSPNTSTSPQSPQTPTTTRRRFEDAVSPPPKPVVPTVVPWVVGKGGSGILEVLPKEIRQKIYGLAFDIDRPVNVKKCCGPETTLRERGACRKHARPAAFEGGRFNILQVSKAIRTEASWVVLKQGLLSLKVDKALMQYLGCYRWNSQRRSSALQLDNDRKAIMWASVGRFRHVKIEISLSTLLKGDPTIYINSLVDVASSLCQSWVQASSSSISTTDKAPPHTVEVHLGNLFQETIPFNVGPDNETWELFVWVSRYCALSRSEPDFDKIAADSGHNLLRLVAVVAKYRGRTKWKFVANTELDEDDEGGLEWSETFQAECAKHGMLLEHHICE